MDSVEWLTISQAARVFGCSIDTLRRYAGKKRGKRETKYNTKPLFEDGYHCMRADLCNSPLLFHQVRCREKLAEMSTTWQQEAHDRMAHARKAKAAKHSGDDEGAC